MGLTALSFVALVPSPTCAQTNQTLVRTVKKEEKRKHDADQASYKEKLRLLQYLGFPVVTYTNSKLYLQSCGPYCALQCSPFTQSTWHLPACCTLSQGTQSRRLVVQDLLSHDESLKMCCNKNCLQEHEQCWSALSAVLPNCPAAQAPTRNV